MDGRKRTVQVKFRVTEAERDLILEKMKLIPTKNMAAYLRNQGYLAIQGTFRRTPLHHPALWVHERPGGQETLDCGRGSGCYRAKDFRPVRGRPGADADRQVAAT